MFALRRQSTGSAFLPNEQQRVVAISCVLRSREGLKVWSLGDLNSTRDRTGRALLRRHRALLARPRFPGNGSGFDLPVLTLRAGLAAGVQRRATGKRAIATNRLPLHTIT